MSATAITVALYLGPPEDAYGHDNMIPVDSAGDALTVIRSGHSALLPPGSWAAAADVLGRLGADTDQIEWLFRCARGGE